MLFAASAVLTQAAGAILTSASGAPVDRSDTGFNPFGIVAIGVGVLVLVILLITFRRR